MAIGADLGVGGAGSAGMGMGVIVHGGDMVSIIVVVNGGDVITVIVGEAQGAASFEGLCGWWGRIRAIQGSWGCRMC